MFDILHDLNLKQPLRFDDSYVDNITIEYDEENKEFRFSLFKDGHYVDDVKLK